MSYSRFIVIMAAVCASLSCGGGGGSSSSSSSDGSSSSGETGAISGTLSQTDGITLSSIVGSRALNATATSGVRVYVDDDETLYDDTDSSGAFSIANVPTGSKCIHASATAQNNDTWGFRACGITVDSDGVDVGAQTMTEAGAISGAVYLEGSTDYQNTQVYVPGTSFDATTDSTGAFTMTGLPAGDYEIAIERDGFVTYEIAAVTVASGVTTSIGSLTLLAGEGCTDNGAVLAMTSISQSANNVDIGDTATFTIEACTSLDLGIDYEWLSNQTGNVIGEGQSFTFTPVSGQEGMYYTFHGRAYIDGNNRETVTFQIKVNNDDYRGRVGSYSRTDEDPNSSSSGELLGATGKYGDYIYEVMWPEPGTAYYLDIVDISDTTNPELVVDDLNPFAASISGFDLKFQDSKIAIVDDNTGYLYDLAANPLSPSLQGTFSCAEEYCTDHAVDYEPECVSAEDATAEQIAECAEMFPDMEEDCSEGNVCIVQEQDANCDAEEHAEWDSVDVAYADGSAYMQCYNDSELYIYSYDVPESGAPTRLGSLFAFTNDESEADSDTRYGEFSVVRNLTAYAGKIYLYGEDADNDSVETVFAYDVSNAANPAYTGSYLVDDLSLADMVHYGTIETYAGWYGTGNGFSWRNASLSIPTQSGHRFRTMVATHNGAWWPAITTA